MTTDNHTATQHEFTRRCLRFFYEDIPEGEYDGSEDDLRCYAETINEGFGYDLDKQIASLTAERDGLREALKPFANLWHDRLLVKSDDTPIYALNDAKITVGQIKAARRELREEQ